MHDCIEFNGCKDGDGYGRVSIKGRHKKAHRVVWEKTRGPIPKGYYICHKCDNPPCCNIEHLFLGTQKDNIHDCISKGRKTQVRGSAVGTSKLTEADVLEIRKLRQENLQPTNQNTPGLSNVAIAKMYGVQSSIIGKIIHRTLWQHI